MGTGLAHQTAAVRSVQECSPPGWEWRRIKNVAVLNGASLPENTAPDFEFEYVDVGAVTENGKIASSDHLVFENAPSRARRLVNAGDTILSTVRTYLKAIAYISPDAADIVVSTGFTTITSDASVNPRFLFYWLRSTPVVEEIVARSVGVSYPAVNPSDVGDIGICVPTPADQRRIVEFLDTNIVQLDELIAEQERLIDRLDERRTTLIDQTVVRGLNPSTPMKDSGIEWLGRIPSHWQAGRLKRYGRATIGLTFSPDDIVSEADEGTLVLRAGNVQESRIVLDDNVYVSCAIPTHLRLRGGDILICSRNGSAALIGKSAVIPESLAGSTWGTFMTVLRSPMNPFLKWVLRTSIFSQQVGLFATSTINQLTSSMLHNFEIPVPPPAEQAAIANYLDHSVNEIDELIREANLFIELSKEYRQALITAAIAGQLDFTRSAD